jgi:cytochrome P450
MMQPAFHKERLRSYSQAMTDHSRLWSARWDRLGDKTPVLMRMEMMGLSLAIVAKTLFGVDVGQEIRGLESAINTLIQEFRLTSLPFGIWLHKLSLPTRRQFKKAKLQLDSMVDHLIASHRALQGDPDDLLSMILEARDEEGQPMSDVEVRDEAKTILVAGHDAVSNSLSFAWYMLSQNPEAEARFHEEIDRVLQGRLPTLADVERLKVTEAVFAETLRLYPVSWILARRAIEDYKLGTHVLPKGSILIMSPWVMHRDQRYFPNPLQFDLERWTPAARQARQRFAYFPFGGGPRGCIGEGFAWMEAVLVLATLGQRWRPKTLPNYSFKLDPYITLRIPDSLPMTLEHRKAAVPVT